jgi:uncharacterized protein (TIGR02217 family)
MAFYDHYLPTTFASTTFGGPESQNRHLERDNANVQRIAIWDQLLSTWDLGGRWTLLDEYGPPTGEELEALMDMYIIQHGTLHGFRYSDPLDYKIGDWENPTTDNQSIGTGDGVQAVFPIFKTHTYGVITVNKFVYKMLPAKFVLLEDGIVEATGYTLDSDLGVVTYDGGNEPAASVDVQVACEFDKAVWFESTLLDIQRAVTAHKHGQVPSIIIGERIPTE